MTTAPDMNRRAIARPSVVVVGDVGADRRNRRAEPLGGGRFRFGSSGDHLGRALVGEALGRARSDTGAATGDHDCATSNR